MDCTVHATNVHYEDIGVGVPVVNLHGWPAEHGQMLQMMEPLFADRRGWRRIYVDLPGMGKTRGPAWLTSHDQMLDFVAEFVEFVVDQPALLVGHSYGAALVRGLLHRNPHLFAGALLLSPGGTRNAGSAAPVVLHEDPAFLAALDAEKPFLDLFVVRTLPVLGTVRAQALPGVLSADYEFLAGIDPGTNFTYLAEAAMPFAAPVLICTGRQDPAGYQELCALLETYPRGTLSILDRAGHLLFAEQPELFLHLASDWLDRVGEHLTATTGN